MNMLLDAALSYAKRGWPVFPCRADKTPMTSNGVLDASTDPRQINEWWTTHPRANIGCDAAGAGFMVLDLDPGHSWEELEKNCGAIPDTHLVQRTPRGGEHLFYSLGDGEIVSPSSSKLAHAVDVRSFNSYVLLAPSRTADGEYAWESEGRAAYRTDEMVRLANTHREKSADRDQWLIDADLPENIAAATAWLRQDAKIAVMGSGGEAMAYATAAHLKSYGISPALAFDLMWEHWNPRCSPPWSADEVEHLETKVINGYSYNTSPPGNITNAYRVAKQTAMFKPVAAEIPSGKEFSTGRYRIVDRSGMAHIRPPNWLVDKCIPERSHTILFGAPGTFKTFIALDLALSVATGVAYPWLGCWADVLQSGPVLFCAGEGREQITKRVTAWEQTYWGGKKVDNFTLIDPVPSISEPLEDFISAASTLHETYKLVVIDTTGRAMAGTNENSQEHASAYSQMVLGIQRTLDTAVLSLAHEGHGNAGRERGSSVFQADADVRLRLERRDKSYSVVMTMLKQKDAEEWQYPKIIDLKEIVLSPDTKTLVASPAQSGSAATAVTASPPAPSTRSPLDPKANFLLLALDKALAQILQTNPSRAWSPKDLAGALAVREDVEISSKELQARQLVQMREMKGTVANQCYDPSTKRFRWVS